MSHIIHEFPLSVGWVGEDPGNEVGHITCPRGLEDPTFRVKFVFGPLYFKCRFNPSHNLLKYFRETQHKLGRFMTIHVLLPSPSRKGREGKLRKPKRFTNYDRECSPKPKSC